jgi:hypothetical protein
MSKVGKNQEQAKDTYSGSYALNCDKKMRNTAVCKGLKNVSG